MIIIELAYKLSLIVTFSVISVFLNTKIDKSLISGKIFQGIIFGSIVCIGMYHPFVFKEGIFFDGRSILISLSSLFFGPLTGIIASLFSIIYRIYLGGSGTLMGVLVILISFLTGYYFYSRRIKATFRLSGLNLYLFGLLTHILMLGLVFTLPGKYVLQAYKLITFTVIGIYPIISLFVGKILLIEEDNKTNTSRLKDTEALFRTTLYSIADAVITSDNSGKVIHMNPVAEKLTGWKEQEALDHRVHEVYITIKENTGDKIENLVDKVLKDGVVRRTSNFSLLHPKKGIKIPIAESASPIKNLRGEIMGVVLVFWDQSEERARLKSLYESEERLRIALESTHVSIWDWDKTRETWYLSPTFYNLLGYEPETVQQNRALWGERIHPDDRQILAGKLDRIRRLNEPNINLEFRIKRHDGSYCWLNIMGESVEINNKGEITRMIGVLIDISQSKNSEEIVRESEARYRAFFENSPDAIMLTMPEGAIYAANPTACSMFGYTEQEIKDRGRNGLVDLDDPRLPVLLQDRAKNKRTKGELSFIKKGGIRFETEVTSAIFLDVNGENKTCMIIRDVTESKKSREEITKLNNQLNRLINAVKDLAAARNIKAIQEVIKDSSRKLIDSDGVTLILREADMCYYSDSDAIEPLWKDERFPIDGCISGWAMVNNQQVVIEDIYSDHRINTELYKSTFVKSLYMVPIRSGSPIGVIGNYWAEKHVPTENEMRLIQTLADAAGIALESIQLYNELETRVDERTAQLLEANKELEAFTYTISHDLRAPLRGVSAFTTILMDEFSTTLDPEAIRYCRLIRENTKRLGILVDDLLAFSRLGRKEVNKSAVDMKKVVNSVYDEITTPETRNRIDFSIEEIGTAYCDESLIRQVWINLLSNAVKFSSRKEKAEIQITCRVKDGKQVYSIKDNGVGFDQKFVNKLFGVFQRLHKETEFEGIGVGLAIIQRIILRHGGEVWAEGNIDKGATFSFSLPVTGAK